MNNIFDQDTNSEIMQRISNLQHDDEKLFGTMTSHQAICHLLDGLKMAQNPVAASLFEASIFSTRFFKWFVISAPIPWPKGKLDAPPKVKPYFFETSPGDSFDADKENLQAELKRWLNDEIDELQPSVMLGPLTKEQWGKMMFRHLDHHLRQFGR